MKPPSWHVSGKYYETCSCDHVCPCILHQMAVEPSKGSCSFAMGFQIEKGSFGLVSLDGLGFIVLGLTPEAIVKGNWAVGLVIDDRATTEQRDAITAIASGKAGGPMAGLAGLIGRFLGVESAPIRFERDGAKWSVKANPATTEAVRTTDAACPANANLALAHAVKSHVDALGLGWSGMSGKNNGQYAPFNWRS